MTLAEFEPRLLLSQQPVLEILRQMSANADAPQGHNNKGQS
jgi:hypothetical protein